MNPSSAISTRLLLGIVLLCLIVFTAKMCRQPKSVEAIALETIARQAVLAKLALPETARFRAQDGPCGEVSYRAFNGVDVGFRRFILLNDEKHVMIDQADSRVEFGLVWGSICNG